MVSFILIGVISRCVNFSIPVSRKIGSLAQLISRTLFEFAIKLVKCEVIAVLTVGDEIFVKIVDSAGTSSV